MSWLARAWIVTAPAPLAKVRWRQASGYLLEAKLASLIVVPKVSDSTRRFSSAMGTAGARSTSCDDPGRGLLLLGLCVAEHDRSEVTALARFHRSAAPCRGGQP